MPVRAGRLALYHLLVAILIFDVGMKLLYLCASKPWRTLKRLPDTTILTWPPC